MTVRYAIAKYPENYAKASGRDLPISTKHSIEICKYLKGKKLKRAKKILEEVMEKKQAIPFKTYTFDVGHKKGMGPGRYPHKASFEILKLLKSVEANAQLKGLSANDLVIAHMCANWASRPWHSGRKRRSKTKRTHVEIMVTEQKLEGKTSKKVKDTQTKKPALAQTEVSQ